MGNVGLPELLLILAIVLLVFGAKRLPEVAKGLGRSIKAFKDGMSDSSEPPTSGPESKKDDRQ